MRKIAQFLAVILIAISGLFLPANLQNVPVSGFTPEAADASGCGIDRTHLMSHVDSFNWQTGIDQRCYVPISLSHNNGACLVCDAAHIELSKRLALELGLMGRPNVEDRGNTVFLRGPVFLVIDKPFQSWEVYIYEGQCIVPRPGVFFQRLTERLEVAIGQAVRDFVPTASGKMRPRVEGKYLHLHMMNVDACLCDDP